MTRPLLYNFAAFALPNGVPELLDLLGFWVVWDYTNLTHRVYEKVEKPPRMKWKTMEFKGGTTREWQTFLSTITAPEHVR